MTKKTKRITTDDGFPIDDRPVIFNLLDGDDVNFVGRYIESDSIFMLSLNDNDSDFIAESEVDEWWYIDAHPTILKEVLNKKSSKKEKKEAEQNYFRKEFQYEDFIRKFALPEAVNDQKILAKYTDGILTIELEKKEITSPKAIKKIAVK